MKKISILGAGNGGQALAGHLASLGYEIVLFEHPEFIRNVEKIQITKQIKLSGHLDLTGEIERLTSDPEEAVSGADIIYFAAPAFAQRPILEMAAPYLENGQTIVLIPGNFGSLTFSKWLSDNNYDIDISIIETDTLPYACRMVEPGNIDIWGMKEYISAAALPSTSTEKSLEDISAAFPVPLVKAPNVIAIGLYNTNMILHCPTMVMNAGRIETSNGNFSFYKDGMSPSVCKVMEEMDQERIAVGKALGIPLLSTEDDMKQIYGLEGNSLREVILNNPVYCNHGMDAPKKLLHRYLEEDVPFLLVPVSSMADKLKIPAPAINNIIYLAGVINGTDYFRRGHGIEDLGFRDLNIDEMIKLVNG